VTGATLEAARPQVRPDLLLSPELVRGPDRIHLVKIRGGRVFEVSEKEYFLIRRLDGSRSVADVGAEYAARFGRRLGPAQWSQLLWLLHQRDLLDTGGPAPGLSPRPALRRLADAFAWAFSVPAAVVGGVGLLAMYAVVAVRAPDLWDDARSAGGWWSVGAVVVVCYVSAMLHELAHGVAATRHGCPVVRINLMALTCRVEDYQYLPSRAHRVVIAAVGGVLNSVVTAPFVVGWLVTGNGFAAAVALVGTAQSLVNYIPVAPLDGYKMLSHLLGVVALGPESRRYLWSRPRRWVTGRGAHYHARARLTLGLYGTAWHAVAAAAGAGTAYLGGRLLEPALGRAAYAASSAVVVLTFSLWLASRPGSRGRRSQP
jgi:putative peptide zinc metalloprotease protein